MLARVTFIKSLETLMNAGFLLSFSQKCPRKCPQRSEVTPSTRARGWAIALQATEGNPHALHARGAGLKLGRRIRPRSWGATRARGQLWLRRSHGFGPSRSPPCRCPRRSATASAIATRSDTVKAGCSARWRRCRRWTPASTAEQQAGKTCAR